MVRLLNGRAFSLRASIHEDFSAIWDALVNIDVDNGTLTIRNNLEGRVDQVFKIAKSKEELLTS